MLERAAVGEARMKGRNPMRARLPVAREPSPAQRETLAEFLARGGVVQVVPPGAIGRPDAPRSGAPRAEWHDGSGRSSAPGAP